MLDQNTDRMWYVIGAVLIGAAIIFGMNTLMPDAFASVGSMFNSTIESISEVINKENYGNLIKRYNITFEPKYSVSDETGDLVYEYNHATSEFIPVNEGLKYVFRTPAGNGSGTWNKRIAYYDESQTYIIQSGMVNLGHSIELISEAPENAKYARISTDYAHNGVTVDESWFGIYID